MCVRRPVRLVRPVKPVRPVRPVRLVRPVRPMRPMRLVKLVGLACALLLWISPVSCAQLCEGITNSTYFAHPTNCTLFYQCDNGVAKVRQCPPNTVFDESNSACVHGDGHECTVTTESVSPTTAISTTIAGPAVFKIELRFSGIDYYSFHLDSGSGHYQMLPENCENFTTIATLRNKELASFFVSAAVIGYRSGSLIMELSLTFVSRIPDMQNSIESELKTFLEQENNEIGGFYVDVISVYEQISKEVQATTTRAIVIKVLLGLSPLPLVAVGFLIRSGIRKCTNKPNCLKRPRQYNVQNEVSAVPAAVSSTATPSRQPAHKHASAQANVSSRADHALYTICDRNRENRSAYVPDLYLQSTGDYARGERRIGRNKLYLPYPEDETNTNRDIRLSHSKSRTTEKPRSAISSSYHDSGYTRHTSNNRQNTAANRSSRTEHVTHDHPCSSRDSHDYQHRAASTQTSREDRSRRKHEERRQRDYCDTGQEHRTHHMQNMHGASNERSEQRSREPANKTDNVPCLCPPTSLDVVFENPSNNSSYNEEMKRDSNKLHSTR